MAFKLRIGSRPSKLALAQTELVRARLGELIPGLAAEIVQIKTSGDRMTTPSLAQVGGKGLFIRELEQALANKEIDLAVHSLKDLPSVLAPEFRLAAISPREDARDVLIARDESDLTSLPKGSRLGTSSLRRRFLALKTNPNLEIVPLRGNVDTRLQRLAEGAMDAIIIAMAGLKRLGRGDVKCTPLDERAFIPNGGQAALALETLAHPPAELERALVAFNDSRARYETTAERSFLATIGASCSTPVGVKATIGSDSVVVRTILFAEDGSSELSEEIEEPLDVDLAPSRAEALGVRLGERMLARGADRLIAHE